MDEGSVRILTVLATVDESSVKKINGTCVLPFDIRHCEERSVVVSEVLFDSLHRPGDGVIEQIVENACSNKRRHRSIRARELLCNRKHFHDGDREREGGILDKRYYLVADSRNDALYRLGQDDAQESLRAAHSKRLGSFALAAINRKNAAAVDFGKVGRIVDRECDYGCQDSRILRQRHLEEEIRREVNEHNLQHKRRSAHDGNKDAKERRNEQIGGHSPKRHKESERQRQNKSPDKDLHGDKKASEKIYNHRRECHVARLLEQKRSLFYAVLLGDRGARAIGEDFFEGCLDLVLERGIALLETYAVGFGHHDF